MFFEAEKCFWLVIQNRVGNKPVEICSEEYKGYERRVTLTTIFPLKCKWIIPRGKQICQDYRKCKLLSAMFYIWTSVKLETFTFCSGIIQGLCSTDSPNRHKLGESVFKRTEVQHTVLLIIWSHGQRSYSLNVVQAVKKKQLSHSPRIKYTE